MVLQGVHPTSEEKRKSKCTDCSSRGKYKKKRKKFMLDNLNGKEKEQLRQDDKRKRKNILTSTVMKRNS